MRYVLALITLIFVTIAHAAPNDMPTRKPGLWEIKMQVPGMAQPMQASTASMKKPTTCCSNKANRKRASNAARTACARRATK